MLDVVFDASVLDCVSAFEKLCEIVLTYGVSGWYCAPGRADIQLNERYQY